MKPLPPRCCAVDLLLLCYYCLVLFSSAALFAKVDTQQHCNKEEERKGEKCRRIAAPPLDSSLDITNNVKTHTKPRDCYELSNVKTSGDKIFMMTLKTGDWGLNFVFSVPKTHGTVIPIIDRPV